MHLKKTAAVLVAGGIAAIAPTMGALASDGPEPPTLVEAVRDATRAFRDPDAATGYASLGACVSGPQEGAMGIHYANGDLIGDGELDAVAGRAQGCAQAHAQGGIVFDDQDGFLTAHAFPLGMRRTKVAPLPGALSTEACPPWLLATCRTKESPMPLPSVARLKRSSTRSKGRKMRS